MKQVPGVINTPGDPTRLFDSCNRSLVMTQLQDFHTSIMFFVFVKGIFLLQSCLAANSVQNSPFYQGQVKRVRFPHAWKLCTVFCHVHSEYAVIKVDYNPIFLLLNCNKLPWCSGYHVWLQHRRSPVRSRATTHLFTSILPCGKFSPKQPFLLGLGEKSQISPCLKIMYSILSCSL